MLKVLSIRIWFNYFSDPFSYYMAYVHIIVQFQVNQDLCIKRLTFDVSDEC